MPAAPRPEAPKPAAVAQADPQPAPVAAPEPKIDPRLPKAYGIYAESGGKLYELTMLQLRVFYALTDSRTPTLLQLATVGVKIPMP